MVQKFYRNRFIFTGKNIGNERKNPRQRGLSAFVFVAMLFYVSCRIDETCNDVYLVLNKEDKGVKDRHCRWYETNNNNKAHSISYNNKMKIIGLRKFPPHTSPTYDTCNAAGEERDTLTHPCMRMRAQHILTRATWPACQWPCTVRSSRAGHVDAALVGPFFVVPPVPPAPGM